MNTEHSASAKEKQELLKEYYTGLYEESSGKTMTHWARLQQLQRRIDFCGTAVPLKCGNNECQESTGTQYRRIIRQYCGIRICGHPGCVGKRKEIIKRKYDAKLNSFDDPRFLTLTLRGYHSLSKEPLNKLNYAWKRMSLLLRKNGYLKSYIKVVELVGHEWIDKDLNYHTAYFWHLHACYDGTYIPASVLRAAWSSYTGGSNWVRVERVKRNFSAAAYLRKYLSKMAHDDIDIDEYYAVYKMKLLSSYGCKAEIETLLEEYILITRTRCPRCGSRLIPDEVEEKKPPDELKQMSIYKGVIT